MRQAGTGKLVAVSFRITTPVDIPMKTTRRWPLSLLAPLLLAGCGLAPTTPPPATGWIAAWGSAQLEQAGPTERPFRDVSLRQLVRTTAAGRALRVQVSNLFGREPLQLSAASVALVRPGSEAGRPGLQPGSLKPLRFNGARSLTLAPGSEAWSDPVDVELPRLADIAVQMHVLVAPAQATAHPGSRISSWTLAGNHADDLDWPAAAALDGWWHLAAVDVIPRQPQPVLVAIGDSITDGYGVPPGSYQRWTDDLARRLAAQGRAAAVVNTGIGGNRILQDGLGPRLLGRFDRDALARSDVTHVLLLAGVNDLGVSHRQRTTTPASRAALLAGLEAGLTTLKAQARARGVCLFVATVMPYGGSGYYQPQAENEADRQALNDWIRHSGGFDAVLDFDALTRDPARPNFLNPALDNDGLHPSMVGYQAMADAFPAAWLDRRCPAR